MVGNFPWQQSQWERLSKAFRSGHLGHALLFSGRVGVGHSQIANNFAKLLLCEAPQSFDSACGLCRSCALFDAGNHPDFMLIAPLEEGKAISVEQIRELPNYYALKPHYGERKLALVIAAESMNRAASNALLKTLEEPPRGAVIMLVTEHYEALSMTIRSRCQRYLFEHVDQRLAADWLSQQLKNDDVDVAELLRLTSGAPLEALRYVEDGGLDTQQKLLRYWVGILQGKLNPMAASEAFNDVSASALIEQLVLMIYLIIRAKSDACEQPSTSDAVLNRYLQACINRLNFKDLYTILDVVFDAKRQLRGTSNPRDADLLDPIWLALSDFQAPAASR